MVSVRYSDSCSPGIDKTRLAPSVLSIYNLQKLWVPSLPAVQPAMLNFVLAFSEASLYTTILGFILDKNIEGQCVGHNKEA